MSLTPAQDALVDAALGKAKIAADEAQRQSDSVGAFQQAWAWITSTDSALSAAQENARQTTKLYQLMANKVAALRMRPTPATADEINDVARGLGAAAEVGDIDLTITATQPTTAVAAVAAQTVKDAAAGVATIAAVGAPVLVTLLLVAVGVYAFAGGLARRRT